MLEWLASNAAVIGSAIALLAVCVTLYVHHSRSEKSQFNKLYDAMALNRTEQRDDLEIHRQDQREELDRHRKEQRADLDRHREVQRADLDRHREEQRADNSVLTKTVDTGFRDLRSDVTRLQIETAPPITVKGSEISKAHSELVDEIYNLRKDLTLPMQKLSENAELRADKDRLLGKFAERLTNLERLVETLTAGLSRTVDAGSRSDKDQLLEQFVNRTVDLESGLWEAANHLTGVRQDATAIGRDIADIKNELLDIRRELKKVRESSA